MKLYILFSEVDYEEGANLEDVKADAQRLLEDWKNMIYMTKDPIWRGVLAEENFRVLFEIETSAVGGIKTLDMDFRSMSEGLGKNLGDCIQVLDFSPSPDCCYQEYCDGEYGSGVLENGDDSGVYADHVERRGKEWGIEL